MKVNVIGYIFAALIGSAMALKGEIKVRLQPSYLL